MDLQNAGDVGSFRKRVFDLYYAGKLQAWVDDTETFKGIDSIPHAIEHMLSGKSLGKVVAEL